MKKRTIAIALAATLLVGTGSAAVIEYFGQIDGNADFQQAVVLDQATDNQASYSFGSGQAGGDQLVSSEFEIASNQDEIVPVLFQTEYSTDDGSTYESQSAVNGLVTNHELFYEKDLDQDGNYGVSYSFEDPLARGNYSVRMTGTNTEDYLIYQMAVPGGVDLSDATLQMQAKTFSDHQPASAIDEVYLYEEDGDVSIITSNGQTNGNSVTLDLQNANYAVNPPQDFTDVEAIGLGYGDASNAYDSNDNNESQTSFDVLVDAVAINGTSNSAYLTEPAENNQINLVEQTGEVSGTDTVMGNDVDYRFDAKYVLQTVTQSSTAVTGDYEIRTSLVPR